MLYIYSYNGYDGMRVQFSASEKHYEQKFLSEHSYSDSFYGDDVLYNLIDTPFSEEWRSYVDLPYVKSFLTSTKTMQDLLISISNTINGNALINGCAPGDSAFHSARHLFNERYKDNTLEGQSIYWAVVGMVVGFMPGSVAPFTRERFN